MTTKKIPWFFPVAGAGVFVVVIGGLLLIANEAVNYEACAHVLRCLDAGGERDACGEQFQKCPVKVPSP